MESIIVVLGFFLLVSFIMSEIFYRLRYPKVIGQIIAGIILGLPFLVGFIFAGGDYGAALAAGEPPAIAIETLSGLGIIFLLLLTGLEINLEKFRKASKDMALIGLLSAVIPFVLGFATIELLGSLGFIDLQGYYDLHLIALVVGACLSLTAGGTKVMILMELKELNTRLGEIMIGAGILDEILGVLFLSLVLLMTAGTSSSPFTETLAGVPVFTELQQGTGDLFPLLLFPVELFVFIFLAYCLLKFFPVVMRYIQREKSEVSEFIIIILVGLLIATLSEFLGLGTIIGALIAGIILQVSIRDREEEQILVNDLRIITMGLIVPFFFISIGLNFSVASLFTNPVLLLSILVVATAGKILGAMLAKPFTDLSWRQLYVVGWGMNSRGAVELVIAFVARPLIPADVFSSIVVMAVVTTILSMLMIERQTQKDRKIMG